MNVYCFWSLVERTLSSYYGLCSVALAVKGRDDFLEVK